MEEKKINKNMMFSITTAFILAIIVVGTSFAYFKIAGETAVQEITTTDLRMSFVEGELLKSSRLQPIVYEDIQTKAAKKTFTITNTGNEKMFIHISMEDIVLPEALKRYDFMWALYEGDINISNGSFEYVSSTSVDVGPYQVFEAGETKTYSLYVWIEETNLDQSDMMGQMFSAKVKTVGEIYHTSPENDFTIDENGTITGYIGPGGDVIIPETINNITTTSIGDYVFYDEDTENGKNLTSVVIPNTVTNIGNYAFAFNNLTNVTLGNSITIIGECAFALNKLENIIIPNSVAIIAHGAFGENQLTSILIPDSVEYIDSYAFVNNPITTVIIESDVDFGEYVFVEEASENQLKNLILRNGVTTIDSYMFRDGKLENVTIGNTVTIIGNYAFSNNQISNIVIPNSVTSIGKYAFSNNQISNVTIGNRVTSIDNNAFSNNQISNIVLPNSITSIGEEVFANNYFLSLIIINRPNPDGITFGKHWNCSHLERLDVNSHCMKNAKVTYIQ